MKKIITYLLIIIPVQLFYASNLFSQSVAINTDGTTAHSSAILDVKSTTKGILAPRMTTVQRTAIGTPAAGLLVYDTDTNSYWYYNGSAWTNISSSGATGWLLTGNSGTNPSTNFIGTSDLQSLRFKVNNLWAGEIHPTTLNTFLGIHSGESNTTGYSNSGLGISALKSNTLGYENTAHGAYSLANNTTASRNTAIGTNSLFTQSFSNGGASWISDNVAVGYNALYLNQPTTNLNGIQNTAIGTYALQSNTIGLNNTALGYGSLISNTSGSENTSVGHSALLSNVGSYNTATGSSALYSNFGGTSNTANGYKALYANNSGSYNTAAGYQVLSSNTLGEYNTANGSFALNKNTIGNENTAIGSQSLYNNRTASRNTAIGMNALFTQSYNNGGTSWESGNVAIGYNALYLNQPTSNINGVQNTAVGAYALQGNTTGTNNTALGYGTLVSNNTGFWNTGLGVNALYSNTSGAHNNALGNAALYSNNIGNFNNALGNGALYFNTSGYNNTAIGDNALTYLNGGSDNIAIGANSGTEFGSPGVTNTISIGNNSILNAASNQAFIGNLSTQWNGGNKTWSTYSDARMKNNIKEEVKGLDFILRLRPVTYYRSIKEVLKITGGKETKDFPGKYDVEKTKESGFLAQEVEKAAKDAGYDFSGVTVPKSSNQLYTLSYEQFVVPLVKAVQEQQTMIKTQQQQIDMLLKRIEALEKK